MIYFATCFYFSHIFFLCHFHCVSQLNLHFSIDAKHTFFYCINSFQILIHFIHATINDPHSMPYSIFTFSSPTPPPTHNQNEMYQSSYKKFFIAFIQYIKKNRTTVINVINIFQWDNNFFQKYQKLYSKKVCRSTRKNYSNICFTGYTLSNDKKTNNAENRC